MIRDTEARLRAMRALVRTYTDDLGSVDLDALWEACETRGLLSPGVVGNRGADRSWLHYVTLEPGYMFRSPDLTAPFGRAETLTFALHWPEVLAGEALAREVLALVGIQTPHFCWSVAGDIRYWATSQMHSWQNLDGCGVPKLSDNDSEHFLLGALLYTRFRDTTDDCLSRLDISKHISKMTPAMQTAVRAFAQTRMVLWRIDRHRGTRTLVHAFLVAEKVSL